MDIDIALLTYDAELITETGAIYLLNDALLSLTWEEQEGQLAQKATLNLADCKAGADDLRSLLKINCIIKIYADWGNGRQPLFEGIIWEWKYERSQSQTLSVTVYDPMIRLQQSKDFKYFSKGLTTPAIIGDICGDWGITLDYKWDQQITHEKKVFNGETISNMIIKLLEEVRQQTGIRYVASYKEGKLWIGGYGMNKDVYKFTGENVISTSDKLSINNLVTRVKVIGKADDEGRTSVDAVIDGNLDYGVLQEIVRRDSNKDVGKANAEAKALLQSRGQPEENIMVNSPDLPFLRRGDAVEIFAGNLSGVFHVLGVSHNAAQKQMTLSLMRQPITESADSDSEKKEDGDYKVGDEIILNGPVYVDSYGNGKGLTFTDYRSTITIITDLTRPCPYHIGSIGWVYPNEITKA